MYQPGKQAKEAYVTIAAQQRNAYQPIKLPAAAKMARLSRPNASQSADTGWAKMSPYLSYLLYKFFQPAWLMR